MNVRDSVQSELNRAKSDAVALRRQMQILEACGDDPYLDGQVIICHIQGKPYVTIRIDGAWGNDRVKITWPQLIRWFVQMGVTSYWIPADFDTVELG